MWKDKQTAPKDGRTILIQTSDKKVLVAWYHEWKSWSDSVIKKGWVIEWNHTFDVPNEFVSPEKMLFWLEPSELLNLPIENG